MRGSGLQPVQRQTGVAEDDVVTDRQPEDVRVLGDHGIVKLSNQTRI